jgi:hypothetical protein
MIMGLETRWGSESFYDSIQAGAGSIAPADTSSSTPSPSDSSTAPASVLRFPHNLIPQSSKTALRRFLLRPSPQRRG